MIMEPEICQKLTPEVYRKYGNRKKPGRISLFVDTEREIVYLVPREEEHIDFAYRITQPQHYSKLVPVHIDTEIQDAEPKIIGIITGVCGLEIKLNMKHKIKDLERAHGIAWRLIDASEIPMGNIKENKVITKYITSDT